MLAERSIALWHPVDHFRTRLLPHQDLLRSELQSVTSHARYYNDTFAAMVAGIGVIDGNQRGDSVKCAERMI